MTDIRTRLADALRERLLTPEHNWAWQEVDPDLFEDVVDALLSLPDIAIVELPEADNETTVEYGQSWTIGGWDVIAVDDGEVCVMYRSYATPRTPSTARAFAAALLAAANAAEAQK